MSDSADITLYRWSYLLIGVVALLLLTLDLDVFVVGDEVDFWIPRSETFMQALQSGDYGATAISTHPGVTTMWLGTVGIVLRKSLRALNIVHETPFPVLLALMRLPVALTHTAGMLLGYAMLRRMLPAAVAFVAAMLWATDPFTLAFSRVLHVDALTGTFATLSLLAACFYWHHGARYRWLILSGVCAALAVLSKSTGLAVFPIVVVLALVGHTSAPPSRVVVAVLRSLGVWGLACVATIVVVWPAVWADPMRVYTLLRVGVEVEGGSPHMMGNFFLGREVDAPGLLFYPVALAMRTTPWTLVGLFLLLPWGWGACRRGAATAAQPAISPPVAHISHINLRDVVVLVAFVILFVVGLSVFPKKFNRYLVPVFPAVTILATVGLAWGACVVRGWVRRRWGESALAGHGIAGAGVLLVLVALVHAAWWHPYSIAYFNQVFGGAQAGARTFVVGWGEGYEQVADYLNHQPDITGVVTVSRWESTLNPFLRHGAQARGPDGDELPDKTGYVVVYIRHVLGGAPLVPFREFYGQVAPLYVVTIHGVEYAWVYQVPPLVEQRVNARFGETLALRGYEVQVPDVQPPDMQPTDYISLTVQWQARAPVAEDYMMFVHVFDGAGQRVSQVDVPPGGPDAPTSSWQPDRYVTWVHPVPVPPDALDEPYLIAIGLYDPDDFRRLPLRGATPPPGAPDAGNDALFLLAPEYQ